MTDADPRSAPGHGPAPLRLSLPSARRSAPRSAEAAQRVAAGLVPLPGGTFDMGSEDPDVNPGDGEGPVRPVAVGAFRVAPTTVTNDEFARFVADTGYRTQAEEFGWSFVFHLFVREGAEVRGTAAGTPWWIAVDGADWSHPEGPGSTAEDRGDHPVVHVSREDALAYCAWSGTRLPTEVEWEYAARGGLHRQRYAWGDELTPGGRHMCNIWQGTFPRVNTAEDGYVGTAPVGSFPANGYGLHDVAGNVWEWTSTAWDPRARDVWVVRGGSYLCHDSYCNRYRVAARTRNTGDSSSGNTGFRVVADADRP
ncbi:formylglycine-generating enzyme family protein [Isoptericola sp. NPDC019693]|uniref:formylglycine-generating enzyme family protein n=1 Tax=Isoptericola sp. NPDC019693 TaxID=3364009 RepID=UPI003793F31E